MQLTVRMPNDYTKKLDKVSKEMGLKRSDIVRLALKQFLAKDSEKNPRIPFQKVRRLLGIADSGTRDLGQHHRRYMGGEDPMKTIDNLIKELPPELRNEVEDFIEFLIERRFKKTHGKPTFGWTGTLSDLKEKYTSVGLQHRISEWRIGGE